MSDSVDLIAHVVLPSTITDLKDRLESGRLSSIDNYICYTNSKRVEPQEEVIPPPRKSYKHERLSSAFGRSFNLFSRNNRHKFRSSSLKTKSGPTQAFLHSIGKANILKSKVKCPDCGHVFLNELQLPDDVVINNNNVNNSPNALKKNEQKSVTPKHSANPRQFECNICDRVFLRKENYTNHLKCHSNVKKHTCTVCCKGFSNKYDLIQHYVDHKVFVCSKCEKRFPDKWKLTRHLKTHVPHYKCTTCNAMFTRNSDLVKHLAIHTGDKTNEMKIALPITYTNEAFGKEVQSRFENIVRFTVSGNPNEIKPIQMDALHQCSICSKCFKDKWKLKRHMLTHANKNVANHIDTTNEVKTVVLRTSNLVEHSEMQVHSVQQNVVCENAPKITLAIEPPPTENFYACCFCTKSFKDKSKLNRHVAIHTRDGSLNCTDATISQIKSMILETPMVVEKDVQENTSNKSESKSTDEASTELALQSSDNLYKCTFCEKAFRDKWQLNRHLVIHTGEKSHVCEVCNKKFYYKWRLVKHQKCHAIRETPNCDVTSKPENTEVEVIQIQ